MCLNKLEDFKVHRYHGWQVFQKGYGRSVKLYPLYKGTDKVVVQNEWMTDPNIKPIRFVRGYMQYPAGYHVLLRKKDAKIMKGKPRHRVIRKVRFKRVVAKGLQTLYSRDKDDVLVTTQAKTVIVRERYVEE